ncbi:MAG: TonB-dependent receptor [Sphingomonas bacterium]|uniref:TonB-dependent receptor n=1 Tax=Sphingomonas bacterium TaxID=1895847 RepID=UPI0026019B4A|nr:TonB-dependent receptor [Sphingomonas bacterium]MDB5703257.1 TonB-dependent receptor [Sphingomonas bacterium]
MKTRVMLLAGAALVIAAAAPAYAQSTEPPVAGTQPQADSNTLPDIVVTAQRTSQSLQRVPIAVTAVTAGDLASRQVTSSLNLDTAVPNLTLTENGVSVTPFLRGVGSNQSNPNDEASVATYIDGVYIPSVTGNIFKFNNVERIEVLKGPQGTLFGRNATGGVIQIITRDPTQTPLVDASIGYGTYNTLEAQAYVSAGLGSNLAADIAFSLDRNGDGYGKDIHRNADIFLHNQVAVRSKILWTPGANTEIRLTGDYSRLHSTGTDYQLAPGVVGADGVTSYPGVRKTNTDFANKGDNEVYGFSLRVDQDLSFARFVSISGYRHVVGDFHLDQDATPTPIVQATINQFAESFSQEIQLLSPKDSKIDWLVGGYFFDAKYAYNPLRIAGFAAAPLPYVDLFGSQKTKSYSAYGQATVPIFADTKLTAGLRYTYETQDTDGYTESGGVVFPHAPIALCPGATTNCPQSQSIRKLTWRAALDHNFSSDILGYLSYNRGIKSGGFNMINAGTPGYRPEVLDSYEAGLKTQFLDNRVRFNVAAFIYDYKDIQVFNITGGGAVLTTNAAAARVHGVDADLAIKASRYFTISAGFGWLDGKYTNFPNATFTPSSPLLGGQSVVNATGNDMIYAPRTSGNLSLDYRIPTSIGEFGLNATGSYRDKVFVSAANRLFIPAYAVVNTTLGWTSSDKRYGVQLWVRNLFDKDYYLNRTEQALGDIQFLAPPRTVGVTVSFRNR